MNENAEMSENVNSNLHKTMENLDTDTNYIENAVSGDAESEGEAEKDVSDTVDYAAVVEEDIKRLRAEFSELRELSDICELDNPLRYAALRDLGLTPAEAYLATAKKAKKDNRAHLYATRTVAKVSQNTMTEAEMTAARELFSDISDAQIRRLYKRVTN